MNTTKKLLKLFATVCIAILSVACTDNKAVSQQRAGIMEGASNFRELGGYRSTDGKQIRYGKIFRSQSLAQLTDRDVAKMRETGIKTVIDFRDDEELAKAPSRLPESVNVVRLPIAVGNNVSDSLRQVMQTLMTDSVQCIGFMEEANRRFATEFVSQYKAFFEILLCEESYPAVFHCTAGKDRTGFAAAMLLTALDADWNTVMEDYLLTNSYLNPQSLMSQTPEQVSPTSKLIWSVRKSYLNAAKDEITQRYGSVDNYLQKELHVGKAEKDRLKRYLLE